MDLLATLMATVGKGKGVSAQVARVALSQHPCPASE